MKPLAEYTSARDDELVEKLISGTHEILWERQAERVIDQRNPWLLAQMGLAATGALILLVAASLTPFPPGS